MLLIYEIKVMLNVETNSLYRIGNIEKKNNKKPIDGSESATNQLTPK